MPEITDNEKSNAATTVDLRAQASQAADSLESLLDRIREGEIAAPSGVVARIEGAVLALRLL